MKRHVVTGGAGFIGSALVRALLEERDGKVAVIDNLLTGKEENLAEVAGRFEFHRVDIRSYRDIASVLRGADTVFHLAAIPSVPRSIEDPAPSHEVNIDGTFQVLKACVDGGARRVIYAASSSAYGDTETLPKVETMTPRPLSPYALQKLVGEYYGSVFHSCYGLDATALRFFNVYGPRQDPSSPYSGVISLFLRALIERRPPVIFGDGEQSRDFTYVEDVVGLVLKAARTEGIGGRVYNAGNGNRYTLNEVWRVLQELEGVSLPARYGPPRAGDVRHSQADIAAAVRDLGHRPAFSLEEGMKRTLEWQMQQVLRT
ncbi:MAG: SDR family oxidoreductase [Bryobacteraceae bacterium]|nr:SDR family oxidoreductase [Bryobacteraceae bacterium]